MYKRQFEALPEDEKYSGTDSVEELLNKMKKGEQLSVSEMAYVKIVANLSDYERAEKSNYIKNDFYAEIERIANEKGIELPDTSPNSVLSSVTVFPHSSSWYFIYSSSVPHQPQRPFVMSCIRVIFVMRC